ncbi:MAG: YkgJ family cysteine cluster protein [Candidatus Bathyarchaeia archaeon]|jgi:Fe-S-cluster containining protein|nr:YkgJ family cysteine cluster protein [Candidatus Bathyarchaeota archaeon A05DMB-4]MDH7595315.1 YkgJ family cysteine cluster protein [Candidatus Bathyarchaeota archaeon]
MPTSIRKENDFFNICEKCPQSCCQNAKPPLTTKRRAIIEAYMRKQRVPIEKPFIRTSYTFPKVDSEGYCVFYDKKTKKCLIHPVKPETCVAGPITFDINPKTRKIEWFLKKDTICSLAGNLHKNSRMLERHLELAKREIQRLVKELDAEALKAILKIEEPETFAIDEDPIDMDVLNKLA